MNGLQEALPPAARPPGSAWIAMVFACGVALTGGALGIAELASDHSAGPSPHRVVSCATAPRLGGRVDASFGSLTVNQVEQLVGPAQAMHVRAARGMRPVQVS